MDINRGARKVHVVGDLLGILLMGAVVVAFFGGLLFAIVKFVFFD